MAALHLSGMEGKGKIARIARAFAARTISTSDSFTDMTQLSHIPPVIVMLLSWLINDHHVYH